jgi:hypothetical protein
VRECEIRFRKGANAAHKPGIRFCCALLAVERRAIRRECQRLARRARSDPDAICGPDCVALRAPLRIVARLAKSRGTGR